MKKGKFSKFLAVAACVIALAAMATGLVACNPKGNKPPMSDGTYYLSLAADAQANYQSPDDVPAGRTFVKGQDGAYALSISLDAGDEFVIRQVGSDKKWGYDILFSSSDALSERSGNIKVDKKGAYDFKLSFADDATLTYTYTPPAPSSVTGVQVSPKSVLLDAGETAQLTATVLPDSASNTQVLWVSGNTDVATVDQNGLVTAVAPGVTTVAVNTVSGGFTDECVVTVRQPVTRISLDASSLTLVAGGAAKSVSASVRPSDATIKGFSFEITAGQECVSVSQQDDVLTLTGVSEGSATVLVISDDNDEVTATLSVNVLAEGSILADMQQNVKVGLNGTVELVPQLDGAGIDSVEWALSNNSAISLTENVGNTATVKGVDFGTTVVTAIIHGDDGNTYQAATNVLVAEPYYFIYGVGFGTVDWEFSPYIAGEDAARKAGLLLEEESRGVYSLTRRLVPSNGFQIIFPNIDSFYDEEYDVWNKNIPSDVVEAGHYFDTAHSDRQYVSNLSSQFKVNAAGVYKITLDLTGESAKVRINKISLEAGSVELNADGASTVLQFGNDLTVDISYLPAEADVTEQDVKLYLTSDFANFADYVTFTLDFEGRRATLSLSADVPEEFVVTLHCDIHEATGVLEIPVLPSSVQQTPVSSIRFEQQHYYFNVNNMGLKWEQVVKANVNSDATNQQVRYLDITDYTQLGVSLREALRPTVDPATGAVTAKVLGTVTVQAVALGDPNMTDVCEVTFYSDGLYLIGQNYGGWDNLLKPSQTTLEGTKFENYAFTMLSQTHFQYTITVNAVSDTDQGFSIAFLGVDTDWNAVIRTANRLNEFGTARYGWDSGDYANPQDGKNTVFRKTGTYVIDVDLSRHMALWTVNLADSELSKTYLDYDPEETALRENESIAIKLAYFPQYANVSEADITNSVAGGDGYLTVAFDFATLTFTVTASHVEFSEDVPLTLTISVKGISQTVELTAVALHHLEWASDNDDHWQQCTDDGCDYQSQHSPHEVDRGSWASDALEHYHECSVCGGSKVDRAPHTFLMDADGYYSKGIPQCLDCGYVVYETSVDASTQSVTITKYNGSFEKIRLPQTIGGYTVTAIGDHAFDNNIYLKQIVIAQSITSIGNYAFAGCVALQEIVIPSTVIALGNYIFDGCVELASADLSGVTVAEITGMFQGCAALNSVRLPDTLQTMGKNFFKDCVALNESGFNMPRDLTTIDSSAFQGCAALTSVSLPDGLLTLGNMAFAYCTLLESVTFPDGLQTIGVGAFIGCEALRAVDIPASVTKLGQQAFANCSSLVTADIKAEVTTIQFMFTNCSSLERVILHSKALRNFAGSSLNFQGCERLSEVYVYLDRLYAEYKFSNYDDSSTAGDRIFKSANGVKHAYYYSYTRPTEDTFLGPFAGMWHYDADGNVQLWADTPADYDPDPARDLHVHIDFVAAGPTYTYYHDAPLFSGDGVINQNGSMSVTLVWTMTKAYSNGDPTMTFDISVEGPTISYNDKYTFSQIEFDLNDRWAKNKDKTSPPIWFSDRWVPAGSNFNVAQRDYLNHTYAFTFTFNGDGLLLKIAVHEVTD